MPIPPFPRVIYQRPALAEVICQLRFPTILKIANQSPSEFQDGIREQFPYFQTRQPDLSGLPSELAKVLPKIPNVSSDQINDFLSADQQRKVSLTKDFMALTTGDYTTWEQFKEYLEQPLNVLHQVYRPAFYERVGLRYKNVLVRSVLQLENEPWSNLLQPNVAAELADEHVGAQISEAQRQILIALDDEQGYVRLRHYLSSTEDSGEECYVIDADYFTDVRTERDHAIEKLNAFNKFAGRIFRWCITDKLYEALLPRDAD